jgi:hypothetical protein
MPSETTETTQVIFVAHCVCDRPSPDRVVRVLDVQSLNREFHGGVVGEFAENVTGVGDSLGTFLDADAPLMGL